LPLEDVRQVASTNWKAVFLAVIVLLLTGFANLFPFPYGWVVASVLGVVALLLGMKLQRSSLLKYFSRYDSDSGNATESERVIRLKLDNETFLYDVDWTDLKTGKSFSEKFQDIVDNEQAIYVRFKNQKEATYPFLNVKVTKVTKVS
jgi:type III secretory pathway component EscV